MEYRVCGSRMPQSAPRRPCHNEDTETVNGTENFAEEERNVRG